MPFKQTETPRSKSRARWPFLLLLAACVLAFWQYQAIHDWVKLYGYEPPAPVAQLADETTLTDSARKRFYVNHPEIQDRESFSASCSSRGEQTIVLGCYHPVDRGIYIFHVGDERLKGVDQVTAAHEVLHAAYDRLSSTERTRINGLLQEYADRGEYEDRIKAIVAAYQKTVPEDVPNEMHSIFATEIAQLPPELETYYARYFKDRSKVVGFANAYQQEFTSRQTQVKDYDIRLSEMKEQINNDTAALERQEGQIGILRSQLEEDRDNGNIEAYNANVPVYNARIDAYNALINSTKNLIFNYNKTVGERNALALQVAELAKSIDSKIQPIEQ